MTAEVAGYGVEPQEVDAVWEALIGDREPHEDPSARYVYISSRQTLLGAVMKKVADERDALALEVYEGMGETRSLSRLGAALNGSKSLAQKHIERAANGK